MRMDKLTTKFQMALADAQSIAVGGDNQYVEPVHVMMALLNQDGGTARPLLTQAGVNINQLRLKVMEAIDRLLRVEGTPGEVHISRDLNRLLNVTDKLAQQRNDQFISSELFLLAAVDDIIVFHPLERDQIRRIAELQVQIIADRLEREGLGLEMTREAIDFLGNVGYDSVFGARPLKRAIQQRLQNPLAKKLLAGTFKTGDAIVVGLEDGELEFSSKRQEVATES